MVEQSLESDARISTRISQVHRDDEQGTKHSFN